MLNLCWFLKCVSNRNQPKIHICFQSAMVGITSRRSGKLSFWGVLFGAKLTGLLCSTRKNCLEPKNPLSMSGKLIYYFILISWTMLFWQLTEFNSINRGMFYQLSTCMHPLSMSISKTASLPVNYLSIWIGLRQNVIFSFVYHQVSDHHWQHCIIL